MADIALKRIYAPAAASDGCRILVERLWPRGVSRASGALDHWLKDISPSPELRKWYGHAPDRWPEFGVRYRAELDGNPDAVAALRALCADGPVTFVYAARDEARNSAVVLKAYIEETA